MSFKTPHKVFDDLLVMQYRAGDQAALRLLVKRWNRKIRAYAFRNIGDRHGAEDIAQEVWIAVVKSIHRLDDPVRFGSWVLSIAHNKSMDWVKRHHMTRKRQDLPALVEDVSESDAMMQSMRQAMRELKPDQYNILALFYFDGYAIAEIADILGISIGTVKSRLYYARESLKKKIKVS